MLAAELHRSTLTPGRLVIVDEASMAATADLDAITQRARQAGAKVVLVGDWPQLSPLGAGGAFRLLVTDRDDVAQLHDVRRFRLEWARAASTALRAGDPTAVDAYVAQGRVEGGDRESMLALLHDAWATDMRAGRTSLMVASDAQTVTDLNDRARAHRIRAGDVTSVGVPLASGSTAGVGDPVVPRRNHRGPLCRPATWSGTSTSATPPPPTAPRGRTVDTTHAYVTATTLRETLYVMATRGREASRIYVDTSYDPDAATSHADPDHRSPADVLKAALAATGDDRSALLTVAANTPRHGLRPAGAPQTRPRPAAPGRPTSTPVPLRRPEPPTRGL